MSGRKHIHMGDMQWEAQTGDVFFLSRGTHFVEDIPARGRRGFEQLVFFYTPEEVSRSLANLAVNYDINTCVDHSCEECMRRDHVIATGWAALGQFFEATLGQLKAGFFENNPTSELLALTMLIYHIVSQPECCLRTRVLGSTDPEKELMERIIHEYIYSNIPLEELALLNNRSLSSFKKKFREHFGEAPHRWVVRKRLMNARLQVIQTTKTTKQIAKECHFGNTSHFINLFRQEYGLTPFQYRRKYKADAMMVEAFLDDADFLEEILAMDGEATEE